MGNVSSPELTARGYEPPRNVQFSVFLDNRVGKLLDLLRVFEDQQVTLAGLSVMEATDHAVIRVLSSRAELTRRLLQRHCLPFSEADVLAVELGQGKTLPEMCYTLLAAELSIRYAYPLIVQPRRLPVIALYCDDLVFAAHLLRRKMFTLLAENDLGGNATGGTAGNPTRPTDE